MKKFLIYISTFLILFGASTGFAGVYIETFEDGDFEPWVVGSGDYVISNGELHMLNGFDYGAFIGANIHLQLSNELIHYFSADIRAPAITNEFVGLNHQWYQQDGTGLQIYYNMHRPSQWLYAVLFYIEVGAGATFIALEDLETIDPNVMNTLSIKLNDTSVTVGLNGIERDIFKGIYYYPETISDSGASVHAHDVTSESDINFYVDNLEANSSPLSTHLLSTSWHQKRPYTFRSDFNDDGVLDDFNDDGQYDEWVVGCNAIAVGQLINYYFQKGCRNGWLENMLEEKEPVIQYKIKNKEEKLNLHMGVGLETREEYIDSIPSGVQSGELRMYKIWDPIWPFGDIFMPYFVASSEAIQNPYNGHWYDLLSGDWHEVENAANVLGGHLVTINDQAEQDWLYDIFGMDVQYWIGFNDEENEGDWVWSSGEPVTYTNWATGEPNNTWPSGEHYAEINWGTNGEWNDIGLDSPEWDFVTEGIVELNTKPLLDEYSELQKFLVWIALGLNSKFGNTADATGVKSDKLREFLPDRFGFSSDVNFSKKYKDLNGEKGHIISSLENRHPVMIQMWGGDCKQGTKCTKKDDIGHTALIEGYEIDFDNSGNSFLKNVRINMGFQCTEANRDYNTKNILVDSDCDGEPNYEFHEFIIFENTYPNTFGSGECNW